MIIVNIAQPNSRSSSNESPGMDPPVLTAALDQHYIITSCSTTC